MAGKNKALLDKLNRIEQETAALPEEAVAQIQQTSAVKNKVSKIQKELNKVESTSVTSFGVPVGSASGFGYVDIQKEVKERQDVSANLSAKAKKLLDLTRGTGWATANYEFKQAAVTAAATTAGGTGLGWTDTFIRHPDIALAAAESVNTGKITNKQLDTLISAVEAFDTLMQLAMSNSDITKAQIWNKQTNNQKLLLSDMGAGLTQVLTEQAEAPAEWYQGALDVMGTALTTVLDGAWWLSEQAQHVARAKYEQFTSEGVVSLANPFSFGKYWDKTSTGQLDEKMYASYQEKYGAKTIDVMRDVVQATHSTEDNAFGDLLVKYENDQEALYLIDKILLDPEMFEGTEQQDAEFLQNVLKGKVDAARRDDWGNLVANDIVGRVDPNGVGTSTLWNALDKGTNIVGVFTLDPTLLLGKTVKAYRTAKWGLENLSKAERSTKLLQRASVVRLFDNLANDLKRFDSAADIETRAVVRNEIKRTYGKYFTNDAIESLQAFMKSRGPAAYRVQDVQDWFTQGEGIMRVVAGESVRRTPMMPRMTAARKAWLDKVVFPAGKTIDLTQDSKNFLSPIWAHTSKYGAVDETVVQNIIKSMESPTARQAIAEFYGVTRSTVRESKLGSWAGTKAKTRFTTNEKIAFIGSSRYSLANWRRKTDRFIAQFEKAPYGKGLKVSDASDADLVYSWALTTFDRYYANMFKEAWIVATEGQRRIMANGMFETILEARTGIYRGMSAETDSVIDTVLLSGSKKDEMYSVPLKFKDSNGYDVVQRLDEFNGMKSALHNYQLDEYLTLPDFNLIQQMTARTSLVKQIIGWSWSDPASKIVGSWSALNLFGPRYVSRAAFEDWFGYVASRGSVFSAVSDMGKGKRISTAVREARGGKLGTVNSVARRIGDKFGTGSLGNLLLQNLDEAQVAAAKAAYEAGDTAAVEALVKQALGQQKTLVGFRSILGDSDSLYDEAAAGVNQTGVFKEYSPENSMVGAEGTRLTELGFNPEEEITVYRGVPSGVKEINPGDWVTDSRQLAQDYAGTGDVISMKIKAKHLFTDKSSGAGAYTEEMVYRPLSEATAGLPVLKGMEDAPILSSGLLQKGRLGIQQGLDDVDKKAVELFVKMEGSFDLLDEVAEVSNDVLRTGLNGSDDTLRAYMGKKIKETTFFDTESNAYIAWHSQLSKVLAYDGRMAQIVFSSMFAGDVAKASSKAIPKLVAYLRSPEGAKWAQRFSAISRGDATIEEFATNYFKDTARLFANANGKTNYGLLKRLTYVDPKTGAKYGAMRQVDDAGNVLDEVKIWELESDAIRKMRPNSILTSEAQYGEVASKAGWFNDMWEKHSRALARISREPIFFANYTSEFRAMQWIKDVYVKQGITEDAADVLVAQLARRRAENLTLSFIDNPKNRSMLAWNLRNIARYYRATEDFYRRAIRTVKYNPEALQKANLAYGVVDHSGFVYTDDQGEKYFMYPATGFAAQAVTAAAQILGGYGTTAIANPFQFAGKVNMLTPSADPESWLPTFASPLVTLPLKLLTQFDTFDQYEGMLLGEKSVRYSSAQSFGWDTVMSLMPAPVIRAWGAINVEEKESQWASAVKSAMAISVYNGSLEELVEEDGTVKSGKLKAAREQVGLVASGILGLRFILGFVTPASPQTVGDEGLSQTARELGIASLRRGYTELLSKYNGDADKATTTWFKLNPKLMPFTVSTTQTSKQSYPALAQESAEWIKNNKDFMTKYVDTAPFFVPNGQEFSFEAYGLMRSMGYIEGKDVDDMFTDVLTARDYFIYQKTKEDYEKALAGSASSQQRKLIDEQWTSIKEEMFSRNIFLYNRVDNLSDKSARSIKQDVVKEMSLALQEIYSDRKDLITDSTDKLRSIMATYDDGMAAIAEFSGRTDTYADDTRKAYRVRLRELLKGIAGDDRNAKAFYQNVLDPLIGG